MNVQDLFNLLKDNNINCFCGVPDSLLKDFCAYITDNVQTENHTITANEGNAIALAAGHYLATGNPAVVYMQNSGIGNCVNPLLSLTDEEVYNIPLLMFIGWRGEPDQKDEPQHIKQGKVTNKLLEVMGIEYSILPNNFEDAKLIIQNAINKTKEEKKPYAFIIRKGLFEEYKLINKKQNGYELTREEAIETVIKKLNISDIIVSTTGHISREVYEIREKLCQNHKQDFLTVGSMGHTSSIALGIALEKKDRNVFCFDGDGAFLMHQGSLIVNASKKLENYKHIIFNNEAHDSVGAQPTAINYACIEKIAKFSGYTKTYTVKTKEELEKILPDFIEEKGTILLEIKVKSGARKDLGRPKEKPTENKKIFMENLNQIEFCHRGAIKNLSKIIKKEKVKQALIFTGKNSFNTIKPIIENETNEIKKTYYNDFSPNPKKEEVDIAISKLNQEYDIILSIGGGSVIDFAKAYKYYSQTKTKLIAIPTTAGTGSEATQFSVIYVNGKKYSIDEKILLPNYSIIDSQFNENNPKYLKACTVMDAYCHAIESYWAIKSTEQSREYAKEAIKIIKENIVEYVKTNNKDAAEKISYAANLAGKAINISRTTASHAISYKITSDYNIPHGHAVALTIAQLFKSNSKITKNNNNDIRGTSFVQQRIQELKNIISDNTTEYFDKLFKEIGLETNLKKLNITKEEDIAKSVNIERLNNNPRILTQKDIYLILKNNY